MKPKINALLVKLHLAVFPNSRQDRVITEEVKLQKALGNGSGKWVKHKLPVESLEEIRKFTTKVREFHYNHTAAWEEGYRLLSVAAHGEYQDGMDALAKTFWKLVDEFGKMYPTYIEQAKEMHGTTFDQSDYPEWKNARSLFAFGRDFYPVPQANHFHPTLQKVYGEGLEDHNAVRVREAVEDVWYRVLQPVHHLIEKLKEGDKPCFRDSLIGNIQEMVQLVPALNFESDEKLIAAAKQINETLATINPQTLRTDPILQRSTLEQAQEIAAKFGKLGVRKFV